MKLIEIFKPGRQTAMSGEVVEFSEDDLRATAESYDPKLHEAPLVIGHPKTDDPAYGWVQSVSYDGVLGVVPHQVDTAFAEMVNAGRFKKVSASFYKPDSPNNPKPGVYYIRHVGFLGAQPPAVKGLKSASFAASDDGVIEFEEHVDAGAITRLFRSLRELVISKFGTEEADRAVPDWMIESIKPPETIRQAFAEGDTQAAVKWLKDAIALHEQHMNGTAPTTGPDGEKSQQKMMDQMKRALAALTGSDDQKMDMSETNLQETEMDKQKENDIAAREQKLKDDEAAFAERNKKLAEQETAARRKQHAEFADGLVKDGKVLPKDRDGLVAFLQAINADTVIEFGEGDKKQTPAAGAWFAEFLKQLPKAVEFKERAGGGAPEEPPTDPTAIAGKALAFQESEAKAGRTINIAQAVAHVSATK